MVKQRSSYDIAHLVPDSHPGYNALGYFNEALVQQALGVPQHRRDELSRYWRSSSSGQIELGDPAEEGSKGRYGIW